MLFRSDKPNILFILSDDQGYGDLGKNGHPLLKTPHLDGLYSDGVSFENFHVSPSCSPTRAALLTGMHEFRSGVTHTTSPREQPTRDAVLLPELLKGAGYRTGFIGKWHLGNDSGYRPEDRGFEWTSTNAGGPREHFDPVIIRNGAREKRQGFREDVLFDEAMDFIKESGDKPFFCYLATYSPHAPLAAPESAIAPFRGKVTDSQASYLGMISNLDDNVGRILNFLKERDLEKNTIVIYMNDNGVTEGLDVYNASMRGCKCTVWEGGTRAMSLWRWPGKWPAHTVKNLTAHLDVLPTLCEVAGVKPPEALASKLEGFSLTPLLESDKSEEWHEERMLFSHVGRWPGGLAAAHKYAMCSVRQGNHLLLRSVPCDDPACNDNDGQCATLRRVKAGARKATYTADNAQIHWGVTPPGKWALYDVSSDPGCTKDLSSGDASRVTRMEQAYDRWWDQVYPQMIANGGDRSATSDAPRATRPATTQTISAPVALNSDLTVTGFSGGAQFAHRFALFGLVILDDVDAHFGQHRHDIFDLFRRHLFGRHHMVQLVVSDIAPLARVGDHLLDRSLAHIQRNIGLFAFRFAVVSVFQGHGVSLQAGRIIGQSIRLNNANHGGEKPNQSNSCAPVFGSVFPSRAAILDAVPKRTRALQFILVHLHPVRGSHGLGGLAFGSGLRGKARHIGLRQPPCQPFIDQAFDILHRLLNLTLRAPRRVQLA